MQNLPLSPDGVSQFLSSISAVAGSDDGRHEVLRLHSEKGSRPFFLFVRPIRDEQGRRLTLIVSTEYVWQKQVETALQRSFSFTPAELNVLRLVLSGLTVAEIATTLGRLESTIRSQIHGLLSKSGARSQAELISLTLAFQDSTDEDAMARLMPAPVGASRQNPYQTLVLSDGRNLQYLKLGDPRGSPFLWLHGNLAQCRLPQPAEHWLTQNGLAMIVPIRAGYGYSSPIPAGADVLKLAVADILALTDYLRISTAPVVAHCNDFLLACRLALAESSRFPHVVGIGAAFAIDNPEEYARLSKWARFFRANARHAPKVLSFLGRTAYTLLRTIGPERYLEMVLRGRPTTRRSAIQTSGAPSWPAWKSTGATTSALMRHSRRTRWPSMPDLGPNSPGLRGESPLSMANTTPMPRTARPRNGRRGSVGNSSACPMQEVLCICPIGPWFSASLRGL